MRPLIGLTPSVAQESNRDSLYCPSDYFRAIQEAGGIPVLLPLVDNELDAALVLDKVDGLLLPGGGDVDPVFFGEEPHPRLGTIAPERDFSEILLIREALRRDMPVLGICRGHQILAVAVGGTLIQDIPSELPGALKHEQDAPRWYASHSVSVKPGTRLAALLGTSFRVNSFHHQSVRTVPPGWVVSAVAPDGVLEALEHPGYRFVVSVQWHPESFVGRGDHFKPLFEAFMATAASCVLMR
ncbi:MAG TPA: gamma-glutamyl-gamma-aminobutyrate hydrolase family protein [Symbiobacteriaceae bacterium]